MRRSEVWQRVRETRAATPPEQVRMIGRELGKAAYDASDELLALVGEQPEAKTATPVEHAFNDFPMPRVGFTFRKDGLDYFYGDDVWKLGDGRLVRDTRVAITDPSRENDEGQHPLVGHVTLSSTYFQDRYRKRFTEGFIMTEGAMDGTVRRLIGTREAVARMPEALHLPQPRPVRRAPSA
jgi:hypothetical protein